MQQSPKLIRFTCLFVLFLPTLCFSLANDSQKAMHIIADTSIFNYKQGTNTYEGNVKIDQGTSHLVADKVITQNNAAHKIEVVTAYGIKQRAHYWTLPQAGDVMFHAQADKIMFSPIKATIELDGNVVVKQGENTFHGPIIIYNIKEQIVSAPASKMGHATIIIEPKQLKS